jgi:asparagine synthase (glutamine-hydrolysing)
MFALKIALDEAQSSNRNCPSSNGGLNTRLETRIGKLFGFRFEYPDGIVIGESLTPVSSSRVEPLVGQWRDGRADPRSLEDDILLLVVISDNVVSLTSSICCCRPLYYHYREGLFCCSTSVRSLNECGVELELNEKALPEFLVYRYVVSPQTLYRGVKKLLGGQTVRIDLATGCLVDSSDFEFMRSSSAIAARPAPGQLSRLLQDQLRVSFQHYSNPGVLLSGGLDSGALAAISRELKPDIDSTSSSFNFIDRTDAETDYALSFASCLSMSHHVYEGSQAEYLSGLVDSIYFAEEPVHHLQSVMLHLLFKNHARQRHGLLICGEGADGLFGNDLHNFLHRRRHVLAVLKALGGKTLVPWLAKTFDLNDDRWSRLALDYGADVESEQHVLWTLGRYGDPELVKTQFGYDAESMLGSHKELTSRYKDRSLLDKVTILSLLCEGSVSMQIWSKLAESQGIALHYPFAATAVVDYVNPLPWEEKLREGKYFIRSLLREHNVSEELITRPKLSFGFPYRYWALPGGLFQPVVDMATEMFEPALLRSLQTEESGRAMLLWNLINVYLWRKLMIENVARDDVSAEILNRRRTLDGRG